MKWVVAIWRWLSFWPGLQRFILSLWHPKFLIGVVAVITDGEGRVLLFHHTYRRKFVWSLPGGWMQRGEEPAETVVREIKEETDLDIEVDRLYEVVTGVVAPSFEVIYLAHVVGGEFRPSVEVDEINWCRADRLPDLKDYQHHIITSVLAAE